MVNKPDGIETTCPNPYLYNAQGHVIITGLVRNGPVGDENDSLICRVI